MKTAERDDGEGIISWVLGYSTPSPSTDAFQAEQRDAPATIAENWQNYYNDFALTRAPLHLFDEAVIEPGYKIRVENASGERDRDMEDALDLWASNCVIHAGEFGHDLRKLLGSLPSRRRGKGTVLIEKVGTEQDPDATVALMSLEPSTFKIHTRERQPILIQPEDNVDADHPRTLTGKAAAYTQYHEDVPGHDGKTFSVFIDCVYQQGLYDEHAVTRHGSAADAPFIGTPRDARNYYNKRSGIESRYRLAK